MTPRATDAEMERFYALLGLALVIVRAQRSGFVAGLQFAAALVEQGRPPRSDSGAAPIPVRGTVR